VTWLGSRLRHEGDFVVNDWSLDRSCCFTVKSVDAEDVRVLLIAMFGDWRWLDVLGVDAWLALPWVTMVGVAACLAWVDLGVVGAGCGLWGLG
jgi:hypothetical protein